MVVPGLDVPTDLIVAGQRRPAQDGGRFAVLDPATGDVVAEVADGTVEDALEAVAAAAGAGPAWAATAPRERSLVLSRAFALMTEREDALAELIVRENGKARADALGEVRYAAEFFRWFAEEAVRLPGDLRTAPSGANRILVVHQPVGVSVLITPWNFPAAMATRKIGPALAAGCTVVLKPASETPLTALAIGAILAEAGAPAGVVNVLTSRRSGDVTRAMLADPRVRKLSFTGSTEVGKTLLRTAADRVVNCSMELGGNAPVVVLSDADLDLAVQGTLVAKMRNGGEACTAANRIYVHRSVADEFTRRLADAMAALTVGPGLTDAQVGPLVNEAARDKVGDLVAEAVAGGARLLTGGHELPGAGWFYPPTVLADVPADAAILGEEIFGPVAPVVVFDDDEEAIRLANATDYGLVAYVFGRDLARALRVGEAIEAGMVGINRGVVSDPAAPFGGVKQSGIGREGGFEGILEYTETKYLAVSW